MRRTNSSCRGEKIVIPNFASQFVEERRKGDENGTNGNLGNNWDNNVKRGQLLMGDLKWNEGIIGI